MGRDGRPAAAVLRADVGVEGVRRQPAPVRVVDRRERRHLVVSLGLHRLRHQRVPAVRSDHHPGSLGDRRAALGVAADARHPPVVDQDLLDREGSRAAPRPPPRRPRPAARRARSAAGRTLRRAVRRPRGSRDGDGPEVERVPRDRRAVGGLELLEDAPPGERGHRGRMDEVRGHRVAGNVALSTSSTR